MNNFSAKHTLRFLLSSKVFDFFLAFVSHSTENRVLTKVLFYLPKILSMLHLLPKIDEYKERTFFLRENLFMENKLSAQGNVAYYLPFY